MRLTEPSTRNRILVSIILFAVLCAVAHYAGLGHPPTDKIGAWYSIVPPLIAVFLALITHRVLLSLATAVFIGGLLVHVPAGSLSLSHWISGVGAGLGFVRNATFDEVNLEILVFVILIMCMISILMVSGGLQGMVQWLSRYVRGKRSAQLMTVAAGVAMFIDDYANTMLIGTSMRPVTDANKVSREKLAFLVDATSAPIAGLAVISTWIGYEVGLFGDIAKSLNIPLDGYTLFFNALSYRFYCLMMVGFIVLNAISGEDFGPMAEAQRRAEEDGDLIAKDAAPIHSHMTRNLELHPEAKISGLAALLPLMGLIVFLLGGLWLDGGGAKNGSLLSFQAWKSAIAASQNTVLLLAYSATFGVLLTALLANTVSKVPMGKILRAIWQGILGSALPMAILIFAWSLKGSCDSLHTGAFLAATLQDVVSPLWFPSLLFFVAALTSFSTGTSWGTMAILIPTAVPVAFHLDGNTYGLITMISLGAVLDGSIFGDHCSPISDTTILSSIASNCDHIHHVKTQLPYSVFVACCAVVFGYLPSAGGFPAWAGMTASLGFMGLLFLILMGRKYRQVSRLETALS